MDSYSSTFTKRSFFALIGFEYAGLSSTFNFVTIAASVAIYGILIASAFLILLILFQVLRQAGFDIPRWIADHETLIQVVVTVLVTLPLIVLAALKTHPRLFFLSVVVAFIVLVAIVYCDIISYHRIRVWPLVFAMMYPLVLASGLGLYDAYYARAVEPRRFDIVLENDRIELVRLIRSTSAGIIYAEGNGGRVSFVNLAKVVKVVPSRQ